MSGLEAHCSDGPNLAILTVSLITAMTVISPRTALYSSAIRRRLPRTSHYLLSSYRPLPTGVATGSQPSAA